MPSDPPIDPPNDAAAAPASPNPPATAVPTALVEVPEAAVASASEEPAEAIAPAAVVAAEPAEPVSKTKEWAVAVAIMIVFALICAQFVMFLRSNPLGGP